MKYIEIIFILIYLNYIIKLGIKLITHKYTEKIYKLMGVALLTLGIGDAFHLIPRIISHLINIDLSFYLGLGKLITSVTMTIFYIFLYHIYLKNFKIKENKNLSIIIYILSIIRIVLCLLPQNNWFANNSPLSISIIRNIPFILIGIIMIILYYKITKKYKNVKERNFNDFIKGKYINSNPEYENKLKMKYEIEANYKHTWLYMLLSFIFYMITVIGTTFTPVLGMFMIPKTICYMKIASNFDDSFDFYIGNIKY